MMGKSSCPYDLGCQCYNGWYNESRVGDGKLIHKASLQFDCRPGNRLHEVGMLVIAIRHAAVNTVPGLVHTLPVRHHELVTPEVGEVTVRSQAA